MIEFKALEKTPNCAKDKTHYYCDYIELIALCESEDGLSSSDVYDRFQEDERIQDIGSKDGAETNEAWLASIESWFVELEVRSEAYGDKYPFEFVDSRFALKKQLDDFSYIYIGLLLCSCLRYVENKSILSSAFEFASWCAMKRYLPETSEVHIFGVSSRNPGKYVGSLEEKVRLLSEDTGYPVSSRPNVFRERDNGDGGVDIIAWVPFSQDINLDKKLLFIGQSASTMGWPEKQHSSRRLLSFLDIETTTINTLYVPYDMRDSERNIKEWTIVTTDVLFDRHRLFTLLRPDELFSGQVGLEFRQAIQSAIEFEEDIV